MSTREAACHCGQLRLEVTGDPFVVSGVNADELRRVADDCLAQLATALAAKSVKVARLAALDEKTVARAKPARWAVLGKLERKKDTISAELRLMEVATGDEAAETRLANPGGGFGPPPLPRSRSRRKRVSSAASVSPETSCAAISSLRCSSSST